MGQTDSSAQIDSSDLLLLLDEVACRRVLARYGAALDWRDDDALASTIWPDAEVDYGFFHGTGEEYVRTFMEIERAALRPFHMLTCDHIVVKTPYADAESLGIALTKEIAPDGTVTSRQYWGRYLDQLHKRGNEWRISRRSYLVHGVFDVGVTTFDPGKLEGLNVAENLTTQHPLYRALR